MKILVWFQFLLGRLKTEKKYANTDPNATFQFLLGRLKTK